MKSRCCILISLWLLITSGLAQSATLRNAEEAKELAEKMLTQMATGERDRLLTLIKPYWPFPEPELETQIAQTAKQLQSLEPRLGKSFGFILARRESLADTFLRLTYIAKLEHSGLRWVFTFYRARDTWTLHSFSCDEDIARLLSPTHP